MFVGTFAPNSVGMMGRFIDVLLKNIHKTVNQDLSIKQILVFIFMRKQICTFSVGVCAILLCETVVDVLDKMPAVV